MYADVIERPRAPRDVTRLAVERRPMRAHQE
jgi:hypothetical protein